MVRLSSRAFVERRLGIALLAVVQAAVLLAAPLADPPPTPSGHRTHLAEQDDAGCRPVHDDLECRICSVVAASALLVGGPSAALAPDAASRVRLALAESAPLSGADRRALHARAPPRS